MLAQLNQKSNHFSEAIERYRKILELSPDNVIALNDLAYLLSESGNQTDEALKYAERAGELAPDNAAVSDTLGWLYYRKGLYKMAVPHLETAVSKGASARRRLHLAMAYLKAGDERKGVDAMQAGLTMDAAIPEAKMAQQVMVEVMDRNRR
jgi:tetratricopeptide (TPR) repeat protein